MDRSWIRPLALGIAALVVLVAVATHFLLPDYLGNRVEERLEEHGGVAEVTLKAVPAIRLLAKHGDKIEIRGSGLEYDFGDPDRDAFEKLDNFDEVDIELVDVQAGPFDTERFSLQRADGAELYTVEIQASASAQELAEVAGDRFGDLGGLITEIAGGAIPFSNVDFPIEVEGELESNDGGVEMTSGTGSVAGVPAGPLTELVTNAVLSRL
jgi:hypothetical protein